MNNRPNGPVWAEPCPDTLNAFIWRTVAAVSVLLPVLLPGCRLVARVAA